MIFMNEDLERDIPLTNIHVSVTQIYRIVFICYWGLCKEKKFKKYKITMEVGGWVGGWVQVSLGIFFFENRPKIALNKY